MGIPDPAVRRANRRRRHQESRARDDRDCNVSRVLNGATPSVLYGPGWVVAPKEKHMPHDLNVNKFRPQIKVGPCKPPKSTGKKRQQRGPVEVDPLSEIGDPSLGRLGVRKLCRLFTQADRTGRYLTPLELRRRGVTTRRSGRLGSFPRCGASAEILPGARAPTRQRDSRFAHAASCAQVAGRPNPWWVAWPAADSLLIQTMKGSRRPCPR